jgi:hypothetical protein
MPPKLDSTLFTWQLWRGGGSRTLGLFLSYGDARSRVGRNILRSVIVGWCDGTNLPCRPKDGHIAVMCWQDGVQFWFHLQVAEFEGIWA